MTFKETFERAATIAEEGWGQAERRHSDLRGAANGLRADADSRQIFLDGDRVPDLRIVRNPALAKALRLLQKEGRDALPRRHRRGHRPQDSGQRRRHDRGTTSRSFSPSESIRSQPPITVSTCSNCLHQGRDSPRCTCSTSSKCASGSSARA